MVDHTSGPPRRPAATRRRTPPRPALARSAAGVAAVALAAAMLTGCGPQAATDPSPDGALSLSVGVRNLQASAAPLYWAEAEGYFDDAGLELDLVVGEAAHTSQLVAGQTDLYWGGAQGGLFGIINSGKPVHTIYGIDAGASGYVVASNEAVQTPADCTTVTTAPAGTVMHAYTRQLERVYGVRWELTQLTTVPAVLANVVAGRTDCAVGNIAYYQKAVDDGTLRVVLDPGDESTLPPAWPSPGVEDVVGGLPETLERNRPAVERLLRAYDAALEDFMAADTREIAQTLVDSDPGWAAAGSVEVISTSLEQFRQFLSPDDGFVSEDTWSSTVGFFQDGGLDFLGTDPSRFDYSNTVDMSYLKSAIGRP